MTTEADDIAAYIEFLSASLERQINAAGGWPRSFVFPAATNEAEQEAFRLFISEIESAIGKRVRYTTRPGRA